MDEAIAERFDILIEEGKQFESLLPKSHGGGIIDLIEDSRRTQIQAWITSSLNLIEIITTPNSGYHKEIERIRMHEYWKYGVPLAVFQQALGLLMSAKDEWQQGLLRKIEYVIAAETFDDFLDHAASYHKANKKIEAAVLAGAVLEDTMKKIARKNGVDPTGKALEELIDDLVKANVITPVKAKRYKAFSGVRNSAFHAEWEQIDIKDVGDFIAGIREMIDQNLEEIVKNRPSA